MMSDSTGSQNAIADLTAYKHNALLTSALHTQDVTKQDFPLPNLGPKLVGFREEVRSGRGFQIIR